MPTFEVKTPVGANQIWMRQQIREAVAEATRRGKLRPNSVDSITGKNSGDNLGPGTPIIHFDQWERDEIEIKLILKGGGCENTNAQYALPVELPHLGRADRTLDGVRKCILHAVWNAQGKGCSAGRGRRLRRRRSHVRLHARQGAAVPHARRREPGSAAGGARSVDHGDGERPRDRHDGIRRQGDADRLQDRRAQPAAGELLRVGRLRLLGVPPPRRRARRARPARSTSWLYRDPSHPIIPMLDQAGFTRTGREVALHAPLTEDDVRALKVGDVVLISGRMFTGRDAVHSHLMKHEPPVDLRGSVLYHCGPVVVKEGERLARHRRRPDDQHPRGAVPGRDHQALRRARGDRQGRHGREDAGRAEGARRGLPERDRRRGAVLRARDQAGRRRLAARVRHAGSDVASRRSRISRRSSRWTRTATACTRTSSRSRASISRWSAADADSRSRRRCGRTP